MKTGLIILILALSAGLTGCGAKEKNKEVDITKKEVAEKGVPLKGESIRIAVGSMTTPKEGFAYYRQLLDYIGGKLGRPVEFIDKKSYAEVNALLRSGDVDMAFVCGEPYVEGKKEFGLELLVAPQVDGKTVYYSYIIVPADSPAESLKDLRGKIFAFADPMSNSGKLVPTYMLAKINETPKSFFSKYFYTYAHDKTIKIVAQGIADGGAVDSLIWEYENAVDPRYTSRTKIIAKSEPFGIPPVVVRPGIDPDLKEKLREILINIDQDKKGEEILKGMMIDKFVLINDKAYDSIRRMRTFISLPEKKE